MGMEEQEKLASQGWGWRGESRGTGSKGAAVPGPLGSAVVGTHRVASGARWAQLPGETCR